MAFPLCDILFSAQDESLPGDQRDAIIGHLVHAHMGVVGYAQRFADTLRRFYYVTPKNYLDLIANYRSQLKSNDKKIEQSVKRLDGGTSRGRFKQERRDVHCG